MSNLPHSSEYKCTGCFRVWPIDKLKPDPLKADSVCCPSCGWPCHPVNSLMFVRDEIREPAGKGR